MSQVHVVIPAYQPADLLTRLVEGLVQARPSLDILLVDDGSDPATRGVFTACAAYGARILRLPVNRGKGAALRAGFRLLLETRANGPVVTADADGQHAVQDILRVVDAVDDSPGAEAHLVIGERLLDDGVPWRSRLGNSVTRTMFRAVTGRRLRDTQTGLRAFPSSLLPWLLEVRGDRYEYELQMLLRAAREGVDIRSEGIRTIYLDDNSSSHFRPVADSVRIYLPLLTFFASSLVGFVIDTVALLAFHALLDSLLIAVVMARLLSGAINFALNQRFVFPGPRRAHHRGRATTRYVLLAGGLVVANYLILSALLVGGLGLLSSKLVTDIVLVSISYVVQARYVFVSTSHPLNKVSTTG
ncbi:MAG: hypothetical protein JWR55_2017 [Aeromicrobium sp.]|nr:hypothetical protein [Aeromicrobium sp.]